jgi:hypothetical protein
VVEHQYKSSVTYSERAALFMMDILQYLFKTGKTSSDITFLMA